MSPRPVQHRPSLSERRERRAAVTDPAEILEAAARFLEARSRSVEEVRRRLAGLGYRPELVADAVERLAGLGYLDDEAFARAWVESRDRARPRGESALRRELVLKGVDRGLVDSVLEERRAAGVPGGPRGAGLPAGTGPAEDRAEPDEAAAERLLRRRLGALQREADPRRRQQRAYALLARNGFAPDVCAAVSRRLLDGDDAG